MKKQISAFSIHQSSKIVAVLYAALGLVFTLFGILLAIFDPTRSFGSSLFVVMICGPLIYGVVGYIMAALGFWVYNLIASTFGGIEFEISDSVPR